MLPANMCVVDDAACLSVSLDCATGLAVVVMRIPVGIGLRVDLAAPNPRNCCRGAHVPRPR